MEQLVALVVTAVGAQGSRVLLTGTTYGAQVGDYGTYRPLQQGSMPLVAQRIDLVDGQDDITITVSGANRVLLTGTTYGADQAAGYIRLQQLGYIEGADFGGWDINAAAALAWPLIDFHVHTHVIDDWAVDALTTFNWDPLEDAPWEFTVDAVSSFAWALTVQADWNIDMRLSYAAELGVSHKITDWEIEGTSSFEWEPLHFDGIDDWTIDMASSMRWVTWGNLKDGICIIATDDQVGVPAPLGGGGGTPRNHAY